MFVMCAGRQWLDLPAPFLDGERLIEDFDEGCVAALKIISKGLAFLIVQCELDLQSQFVDVKVNHTRQVVRDEVEMS